MSSRIVIGNKEVTNPAARAAITIVVAPLAVFFALALAAGVLAFTALVVMLSLGLVGVLLIALAVLIPVIIVAAVIAKAVMWPFTHFDDEYDED